MSTTSALGTNKYEVGETHDTHDSFYKILKTSSVSIDYTTDVYEHYQVFTRPLLSHVVSTTH